MHRSLTAVTVALALVAAACGTESSEPSSATTSTTPTTTATAIGTTTTPSEPAVDWDEITAARYLVHGADGVWTDTGQLVWGTEAVFGPDTLARDRRGGFVWLDASGLWWLPSGAAAPTLAVDGVDGDLVDVIDAPSGPVARMGYVEPRYFDLTTGEPVGQPESELVGFDPMGKVPWLAANGLRAVIVGPEVALDDEGQPVEIIEGARLVISRNDEIIADLPAGSVYEPYARIHDFDGQRVLIARGPYEPALPEETFTVLDLTCGACATTFRASATWAALTGVDSNWDGADLAMQPRQLVANQLKTDDVGELDDGVYLGFMVADTVDANRLSFDLAVWFSGAEADKAARDDGETEIPVPDGFHIRNRSNAVWSRPVSASVLVTSAWYDQEIAPDTSGVEMPYVEFVEVMQGGGADHLGVLVADPWWITIEGGEVVRLDEQYVP